MFLPVMLGAFVGCVGHTLLVLAYTFLYEKHRKRETDAYKQRLLDILESDGSSFKTAVPAPKETPSGWS